jgi:CBS-domain-containing membrane protein
MDSAVLAHHRAVAAMLALSVEGFFAYALHRVGTRPFGRGRTAMLIRDVLNEKGRRVISIGPEASVKQALALFVEHNIGSLPVVEASGQVIGIFSERDVLFGDHHDFERFHHRRIEEVMTSNPITCDPKDTLAEAMGKFATARTGSGCSAGWRRQFIVRGGSSTPSS